jgi:hypothetical protein
MRLPIYIFFFRYNLRYEDKITLPPSPNYDENKHLMFGVPLEVLMGEEGENGLPRVVRDCVTYLRAEGKFKVHYVKIFKFSVNLIYFNLFN